MINYTGHRNGAGYEAGHGIGCEAGQEMRLGKRVRMVVCALLCLSVAVYGQKNSIDHPVQYQAGDSLVMMGDGTAFLHGKGDIKYDKMELTSEYIRVKMDSSTVFASGVWKPEDKKDTLPPGQGAGEWVGLPVFKDGKDSYESNEITYNLKTQKGFIRHVVTEQGEGYIIADKTKKVEGNSMMMGGGQYTTCDDHDHPHFYLRMTKAKVVPGEYIATGPAYLVVGDVPLPLAVPFGFFPFTDKYSSGLIMPQFGDDYTRGLYLRGIGYYFALCDYADLELTGDIYTKGTWAIYARSKYRWRYHFSGNLSINYRSDVTGEKDMPDYTKSNNFSLQWTHSQDPKANPYTSFSASVNFSTSGYNRSNINSYYNPALTSENTKASSISYTQRFPDSPFSLSMTASVQQRTKDSTLSLTLPDLTINMSSISPFKRKKTMGKEKWYEKIKLSYSTNAKIAVNNIKEKDFLHSNFLKDWQTGLKHTASMNASFMLFKYISLTPSISMTDRMYFQRTDQYWDYETEKLARDTTNGFYNVFDFNLGVSMSTKLYGFYTPIKKLFPKGRVEAFRHVMTPRIGFSYHPDFAKKGWGYYGEFDQPVYTNELDESGHHLQKLDEAGNPMFVHQVYSRHQGALYGNAAQGASGSLTFGLDNNLEMKVKNLKDTTGKAPFKVISLIDNLSLSGAYNFIADSMNWSTFNVGLRIKIPKVNYTINLQTQLDPYMYEYNALGKPVRTNKQYWHNHRFPHWNGIGTSFSYTFSNQTFHKLKELIDKRKGVQSKAPATTSTEGMDGPDGNMESMEVDESGMMNNGKRRGKGNKKQDETDDGYIKTEFPWSLSVSYSIAYKPGPEFDPDKMYYKLMLTNNLSFNASLGLGQGWKVSTGTSYDFKAKKFSTANFNVSRDLHCWNMTASFVPFGPFKSYTFHIGVNASMLADLKYDKSSQDNTNKRVNWW